MKSQRTATDRLEKAFIAAYDRGDGYPVSQEWREKVMRRIRLEAARREQPSAPWLSPGPLWRFAFSACIVAVVMTVYAWISGLNIESELASEILADASTIMAQVLGLI